MSKRWTGSYLSQIISTGFVKPFDSILHGCWHRVLIAQTEDKDVAESCLIMELELQR